MKNTIRYLSRRILFLAILFLLIGLVSLVLNPKGRSKEDGFFEPRAYAYMGEPENTMDLVFLGDSLCGFSCSPMQIWQETGIPSYVCSTASEYLFQTKDMFRDFLKVQNPKMVILETDVICRTCTTDLEISYGLEKWIPAVRYHSRWKSLDVQNLDRKNRRPHTELCKG